MKQKLMTAGIALSVIAIIAACYALDSAATALKLRFGMWLLGS